MERRPTNYGMEQAFKAGPDIDAAIMKDMEQSFTVSPEIQMRGDWVERVVKMQFSHIEREVKRVLRTQIEQAYIDGIDAVEGQIRSTLASFKQTDNHRDTEKYMAHLSAVRNATEYLKQCS